jgi:hypothetical protein
VPVKPGLRQIQSEMEVWLPLLVTALFGYLVISAHNLERPSRDVLFEIEARLRREVVDGVPMQEHKSVAHGNFVTELARQVASFGFGGGLNRSM